MASPAALHSLVVPTMTKPTLSGGRHSHSHSLADAYPIRSRRTTVRSSLQDGSEAPEQAASPATQSPPAMPTPAPASSDKIISTRFWDLLAFSGPAPERINGRLAMVGFVATLAVELAKGDDLASQLTGGGLWWFAGTTALLSLASLVPLLKGVSAQAKSGGLMTSDAELWNGRFAMLGLVALVFTEYLKGGALV